MAAPAVKTRRAPAAGPAPAPVRRPAPRRSRAQPAARPAAPLGLVPRAADAVGGIAESGLIVRLTRGPLWIGLIAILLVGIVALNVITLSLSSASSKTGAQADELRLANSSLRGDLAELSDSRRVAARASALGFALPGPDAVRYLDSKPSDAAEAARRLESGELAGGSAVVPDGAMDPVAPETAEIDPVTGAAIDPATGAPVEGAIDPATGLPVETPVP